MYLIRIHFKIFKLTQDIVILNITCFFPSEKAQYNLLGLHKINTHTFIYKIGFKKGILH